MRDVFALCRRAMFVAACFGLLFAGCTEEKVTNVNLITDPATFTVSGRVISLPDNTPVAGATYTVVSGNRTGTTDSDGYFEMAGLSPGTYQVLVSAPGYATSTVGLGLSGPLNKSNINQHRDFYLLEMASDLTLTVRGHDTGDVLSGVTVEMIGVDFPNDFSGHQVDMHSVASSGVTDVNGEVTLTGLPASRVWIAARAFDADGDEAADYGTKIQSFFPTPDATVTGHFVLGPSSDDEPEILVSNMPSGYQPLPLRAAALFFVFSLPMNTDVGFTEITLEEDNYPGTAVPVTATWVSPIRLEVTPLQPLADPNMDYDLRLTVFSEGGTRANIQSRFYWQTGDTPVEGDCDEVVADLVAETSTGAPIDFDTRTIILTWDAVSCAGGYRIYARDDRDNPQWVYLKDEPTDYETGVISTVCTLPESFDRYDIDGIQTPFAGIEVTFCVVPRNAATTTPGDPHGVVVLRDEQAPVVTGVVQVGNGLNEAGTDARIDFTVNFSEYIHPAVADPVFEVKEAGGDSLFALDPATATWIWNGGRVSGRFSLEIPAYANAGGDHIRLTINDLTDLAENTTAGLTATAWQEVDLWGANFDFELSPQGWTRTGQGWQWGTPTIGPLGAYLSQRCWGLTMDTNYGPNWNTSLLSPEFVVPGIYPTLAFWCWYDTDYYDDYVRVYINNGVEEVEIDAFHNKSNGWVRETYSLSQYAGRRINLRFQFTSDSYQEFPGFFLDDVTIYEGP